HFSILLVFPSLLLTSFFLILPPQPSSTLFPYTTLFRSRCPLTRNPRCNSGSPRSSRNTCRKTWPCNSAKRKADRFLVGTPHAVRSEEHMSELQSPYDLVCRLLLEKKK